MSTTLHKLLLLLVVLAPLPLGSNHEWSWTLCAFVIAVITLVWLVQSLLPGSISLAVEDSLVALMRLLCYSMVFFLAFQFGRDRDKALSTFRWLARQMPKLKPATVVLL